MKRRTIENTVDRENLDIISMTMMTTIQAKEVEENMSMVDMIPEKPLIEAIDRQPKSRKKKRNLRNTIKTMSQTNQEGMIAITSMKETVVLALVLTGKRAVVREIELNESLERINMF